MSRTLAGDLKLPLVTTQNYVIMGVATATQAGNEMVKSLTYELDGCEFQDDFYLADTERYDVVLGMDWCQRYWVAMHCAE